MIILAFFVFLGYNKKEIKSHVTLRYDVIRRSILLVEN